MLGQKNGPIVLFLKICIYENMQKCVRMKLEVRLGP